MYLNKVWGEQEAGGTSVLYISNVDLSFLTRRPATWAPTPLPRDHRHAMHAVPFAFTGALAPMAGLNWIIDRRDEAAGRRDKSR